MDQGPRFKWHTTNTNTPKLLQALHNHSKNIQTDTRHKQRRISLSQHNRTHSPSRLKQKRFVSLKRTNPEGSNQGSTPSDTKAPAVMSCTKRLFRESILSPSIFSLRIKPDKPASSITPIMRVILIDWLMELSQQLALSKESLHVAVYYLDRLINKNIVTKEELQVHGLCCLMIAQKLQSQKTLTPELASSLLQGHKSAGEFIQLEQVIVKALDYKLHPFTIWIEMSILLSAFECYFKLSADDGWLLCRRRCLWITEGLIMQNSYYEDIMRQKSICISLLHSIIPQYNPSLLAQYPHFLTNLTGLPSQPIKDQPMLTSQWLKCKCSCQPPYVPLYHCELKTIAASFLYC